MISISIKNIFWILSGVTIIISCDSNEPGLPDFSSVATLEPINTNASGTTFRGSIEQEGGNTIVSYGFIFENPETEFEQEIMAKEISENAFQVRVDFCFEHGFEYYIKAFINYSDTTVFGNSVRFISRECNASIWERELSYVRLDESFGPYGWSDAEYGYVVFQSGKTFKFDPDLQQFSQLTDLPSTNEDPQRFTAISLNEKHYLLNDGSNNIYKLDGDNWSPSI